MMLYTFLGDGLVTGTKDGNRTNGVTEIMTKMTDSDSGHVKARPH